MTFKKYHKIQSVFKRDMNKKNKPLILGKFSLKEFEYLQNAPWEFTEKVDGTNIRILWEDNQITIGGRTDNAQIPAPLIQVINNMFNKDKLEHVFWGKSVVIFGEGYGGKIQSGDKYNSTETFACFDVFVDGFWWLTRETITEICDELGVPFVPYVETCSLSHMIEKIKREGLTSRYGDFEAEGVVGVPSCGFLQRDGSRIITKIKCGDFDNVNDVLTFSRDFPLPLKQTRKKLECNPNFNALPDSALLDTSQAAEFFGLNIGTLQIWRSTGRYALPYIKVGRNVRYRMGELRQFVQDRIRTHTGQSNA